MGLQPRTRIDSSPMGSKGAQEETSLTDRARAALHRWTTTSSPSSSSRFWVVGSIGIAEPFRRLRECSTSFTLFILRKFHVRSVNWVSFVFSQPSQTAAFTCLPRLSFSSQMRIVFWKLQPFYIDITFQWVHISELFECLGLKRWWRLSLSFARLD